MSTCTVSANQPIYQALLDKAASYPADKPYQAKAFKKAAESVAAWNYDLYKDYIPSVLGVGYSIQAFIELFIKANPQPTPEPTSMLQQLKEIITPQNAPIDTKPLQTPKTALDFYYESLKPVIYTAENPRRSARIAAKSPAPKPVSKPAAKPSLVSEVPLQMRDPIKEKKVSTTVPIIRTYGAEDEYESNGYALYRVKDKFKIICVDHCSCFGTVEVLEGHDEDEYDQTIDDIIHLATAKSDSRISDIVTDDPYLLGLYESILANKDVLLSWNPEELDEHLDMIEVRDPEWKHMA